MRFLPDTHSLIWFLTNDPRLPENIKSQIKDSTNQTAISIASLWEIGIKYSLKKLDIEIDLETFFEKILNSTIELKPISLHEIFLLSKLPLFPRDPFDQLIIAQALSDNLIIVTKDKAFISYPVRTLWN